MNEFETRSAPPAATTFHGMLRPVLLAALLFCLVTGMVYPLVTTLIAQVLFPRQANGSLIARNGQVVGSRLIGQNFTGPQYFHGRPSATTGTDPEEPSKTVAKPYNAANSGASNLGPLSMPLIDDVRARANAYRAENRLAPGTAVPVDAVTASASGLDPDISIANACLQAARVARARGLSLPQVSALVASHTTGRQFGVLGEPRVHVLELNLALDQTAPARRAGQ